MEFALSLSLSLSTKIYKCLCVSFLRHVLCKKKKYRNKDRYILNLFFVVVFIVVSFVDEEKKIFIFIKYINIRLFGTSIFVEYLSLLLVQV